MPGTNLTAADRCDRCSAAALVRVSLGSLDLVFCGHHYAKNEDALNLAGATVADDIRSTLAPTPVPAGV